MQQNRVGKELFFFWLLAGRKKSLNTLNLLMFCFFLLLTVVPLQMTALGHFYTTNTLTHEQRTLVLNTDNLTLLSVLLGCESERFSTVCTSVYTNTHRRRQTSIARCVDCFVFCLTWDQLHTFIINISIVLTERN